MCTLCKCLIEMMTSAAGKAKCQEKKLHWKNALPTKLNILYNKYMLASFLQVEVPNYVKGIVLGLLQKC